MAKTYESIATATISGTSTNSYAFTSIPNTYTDLIMVLNSSKTAGGASNVYLRFNNDTAANYSENFMYGVGSTVGASRNTGTTWTLIGDQTAGQWSQVISHIFNYNNVNAKTTVLSRYGNAGEAVIAAAGVWNSTSVIHTVEVILAAGTYFSNGSTMTLYGIKAA